MAGIILFTLALLVIIHFTREYSFLSKENSQMQSKTPGITEKLERRTCEVPFCNTKECVFIASAMLDSMNLQANPCSDFYDYVCGGYPLTKVVPYGIDYHSPAKEAQGELLIDILKVLEKPSSDNEGDAILKMRKIYDTCMNESRRNEVENRTLSFWFSDLKLVPPNYVLGIPFNFEPTVQWTELVTNLEQYQIHTLFKPHFVAMENTAPEKLEVDCVVPFLSPEAYRNTTNDELAFQLLMYKESMNAALELLHMDRETRHEFIEDVLKIDMDVAQAVSLDEPLPHTYLTEEHKTLLRGIWQPVVGDAVEQMNVVSTCKYDMENILTILSQTSNRKVVRYVMWRMLMQMMQYMGKEFRDLHLHYMTKLPGFDYAYESKWKECADVVRIEMGLVAMKSLFDNGFILKDTINAVNVEFIHMKRNLALMFSTLLEGVDRSFAQKFSDKLKGMELVTGYLDSVNDNGVLDSVYNDIDVGDDYFSNILEMKRFKARRKFLKLWYQNNGDAANEISLENSPLGIGSGYDYLSNTVHVDLGLFKFPIFVESKEIPEYLTYAFSSILAHEIVRAFDVTGSYYDADGQYFEKIFWPSAIEQKYEDFLSCVKDQVTGLNTNDNLNINDTGVLNNIMADMGAFLIPYEGLKTHLRNNVNEKPLPGVPLNKKQTFYVQTAQMYCEVRNKPASNSLSQFLLSPKFRVNTVVSNMEDFGSVFNCPVGSAMNLENKCNLFRLLPPDQ